EECVDDVAQAAAEDAADDGQPQRDALVSGDQQLGEQAKHDAGHDKAQDAPPVERFAERLAEAGSERNGVCHEFSSPECERAGVKNCPTTGAIPRFENAPGGRKCGMAVNSSTCMAPIRCFAGACRRKAPAQRAANSSAR